jgi:hypothetical protein
MADRLAVVVFGNSNAGKSFTWYTLFAGAVKTGIYQRPFHLNCAQTVDVFLVVGSAEERGVHISSILPPDLPTIVLCSANYQASVTQTFDFFLNHGYDVVVQWLDPGHHDTVPNRDSLGIRDYLLVRGATIQVRDGKVPALHRTEEIRQVVLGWATYRDLVNTKFP